MVLNLPDGTQLTGPARRTVAQVRSGAAWQEVLTEFEADSDEFEPTTSQALFLLHDDMPLTTPRAATPAGWLTLGFHEDLHEAMAIALDAMLELMREVRELRDEVDHLRGVAHAHTNGLDMVECERDPEVAVQSLARKTGSEG